ncbi:MAG: heavy-metal-associated domain-containing protein, partial [Muribaculaceae bacterium]|nr:heavy-metal-associated domain-containing protein [Muribaculaceae bacterium]
MKKIFIISALALAATFATAKDIQTLVVTTNPQMHCENCEAKIKGNLRFEKGVKKIVTNLEDKTVKIEYDAEKTTPEKITESFSKIGYKAIIANCQQADGEKGCCKAKADGEKGCSKAKADGEKGCCKAKADGEKGCCKAKADGEKGCCKAKADGEKGCYKAKADGEKACCKAKADGEKACCKAKADGEKACCKAK